jgi:hypothetical protein
VSKFEVSFTASSHHLNIQIFLAKKRKRKSPDDISNVQKKLNNFRVDETAKDSQEAELPDDELKKCKYLINFSFLNEKNNHFSKETEKQRSSRRRQQYPGRNRQLSRC